jgi:hypothetical protein
MTDPRFRLSDGPRAASAAAVPCYPVLVRSQARLARATSETADDDLGGSPAGAASRVPASPGQEPRSVSVPESDP